MAGTHKKRIERYITFDEESERYRINLSCIRIWILAVLWFLILPPLHHNLLFIERYITNRLCYILDYSNSEDISLDELEEELEEHKGYDVSQGHWYFSFSNLYELLICMLFDIYCSHVSQINCIVSILTYWTMCVLFNLPFTHWGCILGYQMPKFTPSRWCLAFQPQHTSPKLELSFLLTPVISKLYMLLCSLCCLQVLVSILTNGEKQRGMATLVEGDLGNIEEALIQVWVTETYSCATAKTTT
jgi:hypothetical protein